MRIRHSFAYLVAALLLSVSVSACSQHAAASAYPRTASSALAPDSASNLGKALAPMMQKHPKQSGFLLLPKGKDAFLIRVAMIEAAQRSIDMQYYSVADDRTGKLMLEALIKAADRGVRVRVLVDDLHAERTENTLLVLDGHPNIEIRVFNPFTLEGESIFSRLGNSISGYRGLMRRMHNKAFIVDSYVAVVGGRNLEDKYFGYGEESNFRDLDVFAAGPLIQTISHSYDRYWNSEESYPINAMKPPVYKPEKLQALRDNLDKNWAKEKQEGELRGLIPLSGQLSNGNVSLVWASAEFHADPPEKIENPEENSHSVPAREIAEETKGTKSEILIISPYLIPGERGLQWIEDMRQRGVAVHVLTNSLASSDVIAVHAHYRENRERLLKAGVELHELKPEGRKGKRHPVTLHTKAYVVDRKELIIGSFNFDQRSLHLNTEMMVTIHSPELAAQATEWFERITAPSRSYELSLQKGSHILWKGEEDNAPVEYTHEPESSPWRRFKAEVLSILPIENQL